MTGEDSCCVVVPKGRCTQTVYIVTLQSALYRYLRGKVYAVWVHGPVESGVNNFSLGLTAKSQ